MRTGVAALLLVLLLAAPAAAKPRLSAALKPDGSVRVALKGVSHVKRVVVRWGDGAQTAGRTHRYAAPGTYTIRARAVRRGKRTPRSAATKVLVPGPVAAHHVAAYLVSDTLACGAVSLEAGGETTSCGTSLSLDGVLHDASSFVPVTSFSSGDGTAADPFVLTRVVRAAGRVELLQTTRYTTGSDTAALETYSLRSVDGQQHVVVLYRTVDCVRGREGALTTGGATCRAPAAPTSTASTLFDRGQGGHRAEGTPADLLTTMNAGDDFADTARRGRHDTAVGLSWRMTLPTTSAATVVQASQLVLSAG